MDHNATTKVPAEISNKISEIMSVPLNSSSIHTFGRYSKGLIEETRSKLREILNITDDYYIIFTSCGTEANNLILNIRCDAILTSNIEHTSILNVVGEGKIKCNRDCVITPEAILDAMNKLSECETTLISVMLANNETGVIQPIEQLCATAKSCTKSNSAIFHTDASQAVGKIKINVDELGVDALTLSGHKFGAPLGVGVLVIKKDIANKLLNPIIEGGGQEYGFRSGTVNSAAVYGLGLACDLINDRILKLQNTKKLIDLIKTEIKKVSEDVIFFGEHAHEKLPNTLSISMPNNVKAETQVIFFDMNGIAISAGAACSSGKTSAPHVQLAMGYDRDVALSAIRISLDHNNTEEEVRKFIELWKKLYLKHNKI